MLNNIQPISKDRDNLDKLKKIRFTAHNIQLNETYTTFNLSKQEDSKNSIVHAVTGIDYSVVPLISRMPSYLAIQQLLNLCGIEQKKHLLKLVDLGCLEGGFSIEFAKSGFQSVLGIEGRKSNFEKCEALSEYLCLDNLIFKLDDVKNIKNYNDIYDVILCLGLLYHLDSPIEFLDSLNKHMPDKGVLFLETHYAPKDEHEHDKFFLPYVYPDKNTYEIEYLGHKYQGCWWHEHSSSTPECKKHPWSAVSNSKSFVPTLQSLMEALYNTGFKQIYAIHNPVINKIEENWFRVLWACFKDF